MATKVLKGLPPDVLRIIDRKVREGEYESEEEFIQQSVHGRVSEFLLEELQRRHGRPRSANPAEVRRMVRLVAPPTKGRRF